MKYNYSTPDAVVEHRELRCTERLSKYELCPNATPEPIRKEALTRLATKRSAFHLTNRLGTPGEDGVAYGPKKETFLPSLDNCHQLPTLAELV